MSEHGKKPAEVTEPSIEELRAQGFEGDVFSTKPLFILLGVVTIILLATSFLGWQYLRYEQTKEFRRKQIQSNEQILGHRKLDATLLEKGKKDPKTGKLTQKPIANAMQALLANPVNLLAPSAAKKPEKRAVAPKKPEKRTVAPKKPEKRAVVAVKPTSRAASKPKVTQPASRPANR